MSYYFCVLPMGLLGGPRLKNPNSVCMSQYPNRSFLMVKEHILGNRHLKEALKALITIAMTLTDSFS